MDAAYSVAVDSLGNVYATGAFTGTVDFDPGPGIFNLIAAGETDIFVLKLDAAGNFVWAKKMGGLFSDSGNSIVVDTVGDVYSSGQFSGTSDFDPGAGSFNLTTVGSHDIFISKLDSSGNFIWAKSMGGIGYDNTYSTRVDSSGNICTTGYFENTADFDPGSGVFDLISSGGKDVFIQKLDPAGNFVWARNIGGTADDEGKSISSTSTGEIYTTGYFEGTADFDPDAAGVHNEISAGGKDIFISRLDANGNFISVKIIGGSGDDAGNFLLIDGADKVYLTGYFEDTVDFSPGPGTLNLVSAGAKDAYFLKFNPANNALAAGSLGGNLNDEGNALAVNSAEDILICGSFEGTGDFNPGAGVHNLTSFDFKDIFFVKVGPGGTFRNARSIGNLGSDVATALISDPTGRFYSAGWINTTVDLNPGTGVVNHTSAGDFDLFILKL